MQYILAAVVTVAFFQGHLNAQEKMRAHFIDVGQGDATLLEFPGGVALIDAGGGRHPSDERFPAEFDGTEVLMAYLTDFFSKPENEAYDHRLDLLVLTHPHKDHTRSAPAVIDAFQPKNVVHNGQWEGSGIEGQNYARAYVEETDAQGWYVLQRTIPSGGLSNGVIDPIGPKADGGVDPVILALWGKVDLEAFEWDFDEFRNGNNHSVVLHVAFGQASLLFTGDLEEGHRSDAGIESLLQVHGPSGVLDADVYQVGHHGSHNGNSDELMDAVMPKIAVISCGPPKKQSGYTAWSFGHPRDETIRELERAVSCERGLVRRRVFERPRRYSEWPIEKAIYSTGWDGTVVLEGRADGYWTVLSPGEEIVCQ